MDISGLRAAYEGHTPTLMGERGGSAVLVPLVRQNGEYCLLYEIRSAAVRQPGEVCFPGGKREPGETAIQCALRETREETRLTLTGWRYRETREELGIPESAVTVIGEMDFLYIRAGSLLRPVLGEVDPAAVAAMRPAPEEVAGTFLLPLRELRAHPPEVYAYQQPVAIPDFPYADAGVAADYPWRPCRIEVPVYRGLPHPLWGITARITMDVVDKL